MDKKPISDIYGRISELTGGDGVQQIAEAISGVLQLDVTVANKDRVRVAGTGQYRNTIGKKLPYGSGYHRIKQVKEMIFIEEPGYDELCITCEQYGDCPEKTHILAPILADGEVVGSIGITAFEDHQKEQIYSAKHEYRDFILQMSKLLAAWFVQAELLEERTRAYTQMNALVDSVYEGIVAVDDRERIIALNKSAEKLLAIDRKSLYAKFSEVLPELSFFLEVISNREKIVGREITVAEKNIHCMTNVIPVKMNDKVVGAVATVRDMKEVRQMAFQMSGNDAGFTFDSIIGKSKIMEEAKQKAKNASQTDSTILIRGESGTGKDLYARAIHAASNRGNYPFVAVHCGAIPETLLESELFGYEEGAFTGAKKGGKPGKFELSDKGTIFLDEIGDMSMHLQVKLLRVLQDGQFERIGGKEPIRVDVRVVAATHQPLEEMMAGKQFRQDLFYRLNVIPLFIPPLRERKDDVPLLLNHYLKRYAKTFGIETPRLTPQAMDRLMAYHWPGNVRELENLVEYILNMKGDQQITEKDLPEHILVQRDDEKSEGEKPANLLQPLQDLEQKALEQAVDTYGLSEEGKQMIAKKLGISRATVYRKLKKYRMLPKQSN